MVVQIFVPQAQTKQPLFQQINQRMLDKFWISMVGETSRELLDKAKAFLDFPQQNPAAIRCNPSPIKPGYNFPPADLLKSKRPLSTLCLHETASSVKCKCVFAPSFTSGRAVSCHPVGEKCRLDAM